MYLMIDNYDSFVYNLVMYFKELDIEMDIRKNDEISLEEVIENNYEGIVISPGPKGPEDSGISIEILKKLSGKIPILGICLGHQTIAHVFGGEVVKGKRPMHGKISEVTHYDSDIFENIPNKFLVTRYHSLVVKEDSLPKSLTVEARSEDNCIMAIANKELSIYGLQFHPEALLTEYGHAMLQNFINICKKWGN